MKEIRLHGRGGQGGKMAADILSTANILIGKYGTSFPLFTAERRGAPMVSFARLDDVPIREKDKIYNPDCIIVLDPNQVRLETVYSGVKPGAILVANSSSIISEGLHPNIDLIGVVNATKIAIEEIGVPAFNTCMLGAFAATTKWIGLNAILSALEGYFVGKALNGNKRSAERGYQEVKLIRR